MLQIRILLNQGPIMARSRARAHQHPASQFSLYLLASAMVHKTSISLSLIAEAAIGVVLNLRIYSLLNLRTCPVLNFKFAQCCMPRSAQFCVSTAA